MSDCVRYVSDAGFGRFGTALKLCRHSFDTAVSDTGFCVRYVSDTGFGLCFDTAAEAVSDTALRLDLRLSLASHSAWV